MKKNKIRKLKAIELLKPFSPEYFAHLRKEHRRHTTFMENCFRETIWAIEQGIMTKEAADRIYDGDYLATMEKTREMLAIHGKFVDLQELIALKQADYEDMALFRQLQARIDTWLREEDRKAT